MSLTLNEIYEIAKTADVARNLAGSLISAIQAAWRGQPSEDPTQKKIYEITAEHYHKFRHAINNDNMRIILHLETCDNCNPRNLFQEVHRDNSEVSRLSPREKDFVIKEFSWRLEYLSTIGLISAVTGGEYAISHLGKNFVRRARDVRDYLDLMRS